MVGGAWQAAVEGGIFLFVSKNCFVNVDFGIFQSDCRVSNKKNTRQKAFADFFVSSEPSPSVFRPLPSVFRPLPSARQTSALP